jgi:hypothetical protein
MRRSLLALSLLVAPAGAAAQQPAVPRGPVTLLEAIAFPAWTSPPGSG